MGKVMGVIGLGATGALVANLAVSLEMTVYGHDPFMSVDAAWNLSREVIRAETLDDMLAKSDYISLNVPYTEETHHMIDRTVLGFVVDFIDFCACDFWVWVFNIADAAVCVGAALFVLDLVLELVRDFKGKSSLNGAQNKGDNTDGTDA